MENQAQQVTPQSEHIQPQMPVQQTPQPTQTQIESKKSFPIWIIFVIFLILLLILIIGAYFLGTNNSNNPKTAQNSDKTTVTNFTPTPRPITATDIASWKTYTGANLSFKYPNDWYPTEQSVDGGVINTVSVNLGISTPEVNEQSLGFSNENLNDIDKSGSVEQLAVVIGNKNGFKLIRKSEGFIVYDYITSGINDQGSFIVHVTTKDVNKALENQLDKLSETINFKN